MYELVKSGSYYFLSRPRRFGKSLLLSTFEAYFQVKKELFQGLAVEKMEKDWIQYPILHLDLNTQKYDSPESLDNILNMKLDEWLSLIHIFCGVHAFAPFSEALAKEERR